MSRWGSLFPSFSDRRETLNACLFIALSSLGGVEKGERGAGGCEVGVCVGRWVVGEEEETSPAKQRREA